MVLSELKLPLRLCLPLVFLPYLTQCGNRHDRSQPGTLRAPQARSTSTKPVLQECYKAEPFICEVEASIVTQVNQKRASSGLQPLIQSFEASFAARVWSKAQAEAGKISHEGFPVQREASIRAEFPNTQIAFFAENVAYGYPNSQAAAEVAQYFVDMWWNSAGHRENILGPYRYIGVGVEPKEKASPSKAYFGTQLFYN